MRLRPRHRGRPPRYPFALMAVGQSYICPREESRRVRSALSQHMRRHGVRFRTSTDETRLIVTRIE